MVIIRDKPTEESHSFDVRMYMNGEFCVFSSSGIFVRFMIVVFVSSRRVVEFAFEIVLLNCNSCLTFMFEWCFVALILKSGVTSEHECSSLIAIVYFPEC